MAAHDSHDNLSNARRWSAVRRITVQPSRNATVARVFSKSIDWQRPDVRSVANPCLLSFDGRLGVNKAYSLRAVRFRRF